MSAVTTPAPRDEHEARAARLRRANVRLAVILALVAAAVYVGFVATGLS